MTKTIKKDSKPIKKTLLNRSVDVIPKESGRFKYEINLQRIHTKFKGITYENKKIGRTKSFNSISEIDKYLSYLENEYKNIDLSVSTDSKRDYKNAREALDNKGFNDISVTEAINKWLQHQPTVSDLTVLEAWEEFIKYKKDIDDVSDDTVRSLKNNCYKSLEPFLNLPLTDFEQPNCGGKLKSYIETTWKNRVTRNHHFVKTSEFFNYFLNMEPKKISKNPIGTRPKFDRKKYRKQPKVASIIQVERILEIARNTDDELGTLAFWVITFFLGCRPQSEMKPMTWDDIYLDDPSDRYLMVADETKTGFRRVDISEQVYQWLTICNRKKPIYPIGYTKKRRHILNLADVLNDNMTTEEKKRWQDFQRHTCVSCKWRSKMFDLAEIVDQMGHDYETNIKYYKNANVSKADAIRYWKLLPTNTDSKIIKIA